MIEQASEITRQKYQPVLLEKVLIACRETIPSWQIQDLRVEVITDHFVSGLVAHLEAYLIGKSEHETEYKNRNVQTIQIPASWWEMWKRDHAPKWMLTRWPVKYNETEVVIHETVNKTITRICPHWPDKLRDDRNLGVIARFDREPHLDWLVGESRTNGGKK